MLEGTLSVYAFILIFPLAVFGGLIFLIRNYIRTTEFCDPEARLDGRTIIVTGGSSGLGRTLSVELARRGARVIVACRTKARRDSTAFFLRSKTGSFNIRSMYMDLTSLDSVYDFCRDVVESESRIDGIVNNAATLYPQEKTADDLDLMLGVNYVGHFLLVSLLQPKMLQHGTATLPSRLINVVCPNFRSGYVSNMDDLEGKVNGSYNIRQVYRNSKYALHLLTRFLADKYREEGLLAYSVDPGYLNTGLYRHLEGPIGKLNQICAKALYRTTEEGTQTILYCLTAKEIMRDTGKLFKDCRVVDFRVAELTETAIKQLWDRTSELIQSKGISLELKPDEEEEEEETEQPEREAEE